MDRAQEKLRRGGIELKVFPMPSDKRSKEISIEQRRRTDADQQYFIHAADCGERFGSGRAPRGAGSATAAATAPSSAAATKPATPSSSAGGSSEVRRRVEAAPSGAAVRRRLRFRLTTPTRWGARAIREAWRIERGVRGVGSEPAGSQCQWSERAVGRKQSERGDRRAGVSERTGVSSRPVRSWFNMRFFLFVGAAAGKSVA